MAKIVIFTNHTLPMNTGGCEVVVDAIASRMASHGHSVCVAGADVSSPSTYNGYLLTRGNSEGIKSLLSELGEKDCVLVYSDSFFHWHDVLMQSSSRGHRVVLCTVGFLASRKSPVMIDLIRRMGERIKIVVHSSVHEECSVLQGLSIPFCVIPNGVDPSEFDGAAVKKSVTPRIVTVANCYPGKGHGQAIEALRILHGRGVDFTWLVCCTTPTWPVARRMTASLRAMMPGLGFQADMMLDHPRSDVCKAISESSVMLHASLAEVAPLVILEAMAAKTPWVAFEVGNLSSLAGGLICGAPPSTGSAGCDRLADGVEMLLKNDSRRSELADEGVRLIQKEFTWDRILQMYESACFG
jgi:glycosyltransferase involved in cell wall biosynthesis